MREAGTHSFRKSLSRSPTNPDRVPSPSDRVTKEFVVINSGSLPAALSRRGVASPTYPIDVFENRHWRKMSEWRSRDEHSRRLPLHERAWYSTGYFLASECQGRRQRESKKIYAGTLPRDRANRILADVQYRAFAVYVLRDMYAFTAEAWHMAWVSRCIIKWEAGGRPVFTE